MEGLSARGPSRGVAHAARAYLAGVGTAGSLLAAAALVFIVASALVAFHGWPHLAVQPSRARSSSRRVLERTLDEAHADGLELGVGAGSTDGARRVARSAGCAASGAGPPALATARPGPGRRPRRGAGGREPRARVRRRGRRARRGSDRARGVGIERETPVRESAPKALAAGGADRDDRRGLGGGRGDERERAAHARAPERDRRRRVGGRRRGCRARRGFRGCRRCRRSATGGGPPSRRRRRPRGRPSALRSRRGLAGRTRSPRGRRRSATRAKS